MPAFEHCSQRARATFVARRRVVATVDALNGARQLDEHPEAVKQAAVADRLLISKTDLADIDTSAHLRARLEDLNPGAPLYEVVQGEIDPALLFDSGPFDPAGKSDRVQQWLNAEAHDHHHHSRASRSLAP